MKIVIIAALARDGTIGNAGKIPWHIRDDLQRFKRLTLGHPVIMGRKTWDSLGRPLPGRRNIVLTRSAQIPGAECFPDLDAALAACGDATVFIIGGAEIYRLALPRADELYLTHVPLDVTGDTKFPALDPADWAVVSREQLPDHEFVIYRRR